MSREEFQQIRERFLDLAGEAEVLILDDDPTLAALAEIEATLEAQRGDLERLHLALAQADAQNSGLRLVFEAARKLAGLREGVRYESVVAGVQERVATAERERDEWRRKHIAEVDVCVQRTYAKQEAERRVEALTAALDECPMPSDHDSGVWWDYWQLARAAVQVPAEPPREWCKCGHPDSYHDIGGCHAPIGAALAADCGCPGFTPAEPPCQEPERSALVDGDAEP